MILCCNQPRNSFPKGIKGGLLTKPGIRKSGTVLPWRAVPDPQELFSQIPSVEGHLLIGVPVTNRGYIGKLQQSSFFNVRFHVQYIIPWCI